MAVVIEAAEVGEAGVERVLAGVAERRMAEVVAERNRLGQILVERESAAERAGELRNLDGVRQPRAEMVALVVHEHLRLVRKAAEGGRMDDAVAVALERSAGRRIRLRTAAARARREGRRRAASGAHKWGPTCEFAVAVPAARAYVLSGNLVHRDCDMSESPALTISATAARQLNHVLAGDPGAALRISVKGGGCSGFQYEFDVDKAPRRRRFRRHARRRDGHRRSRLARDDEGSGTRFRRRPDGARVQGQEPERGRLVRLRRQFFAVIRRRLAPNTLTSMRC